MPWLAGSKWGGGVTKVWMAVVVSASERNQSFGRLEIRRTAISCLIEFHGTLISVHFDVRKADAFNKKSAHRFYWGIQMLPVPSCHQLHFSHIVVTLSLCLRQVLREERY